MGGIGAAQMGEADVVGRSSAARSLLQQAFRDWGGMAARLPLGVYVCDRKGHVVLYNARAIELWGDRPPAAGGEVPFYRAYHADGSPMTASQSPVAETLATGAPVKDREVVIIQSDGRRTHLLANAEPLFDPSGALIGAVNCLQDVTELRQVRDMLRTRQTWSRRVVDASPIAVYQTDAKGVVLSFNPAAAALWGREPKIGVDQWCGAFKLYQPDGAPLPLDKCPMAVAIREKRQIVAAEALFERPDGSRGAFLAYPTPMIGSDGEVFGAVNMLVDITERKRAEDLQKTLLDELNHRVKNTLATVQSLAVHSFHDAGDPAGMRKAFEARLMALSGAHNRLAERRWEAADLCDIAQGILAPYGGDAITLEGPSLQLSTRASVTFAMILHELATNAAKHGALSVSGGRLSLTWRREGDCVLVEWREAGGPSCGSSPYRGFGLRFIRRAVERELAGQVSFDFSKAGLFCRISAPIPAAV